MCHNVAISWRLYNCEPISRLDIAHLSKIGGILDLGLLELSIIKIISEIAKQKDFFER